VRWRRKRTQSHATDSSPDFRAASPAQTRFHELGPLGELPGPWSGHGFNLIARPDHQQGNILFLELNPTDEHLTFTAIGGAIPNRGSEQDDIEIFGIHYLQQITDSSNSGAIQAGFGPGAASPARTRFPATGSATTSPTSATMGYRA